MNQNLKKNNPKESPWYSAAKNIAIISGVFSLVVASLLLFNYLSDGKHPVKEPVYSSKLLEQKAQLAQNPRNEELKKEIRKRDFELRQGYFQRLAFSNRGKYLLLFGLIIFIASLKTALELRKARPKPKPPVNDASIEKKEAVYAQKAISILGLIIVCFAVVLSLLPRIELEPSPSSKKDGQKGIASAKPEFPTQAEILKNWPVFRGPGGVGVSTHEKIPVSWNGQTGEGILWKTALQTLPGNNSPIVWGNRLFFSGATEKEKEIYCFSTGKGELLWKGPIKNVPGNTGKKINASKDSGYAPSTMACDGSRVYAIFVDGDVACFDFDGKLLWAKNLGTPDSIYGYATSLNFFQNRVLIQYDQGTADDGKSVLYALDGKNGNIAWQTKRPVANSWTSPIIINSGTDEQLVTCSEPWVISYNPVSGEELWRANLMGTDLAPSPAYGKGRVFVVQPNESMFAIKPDGRGDITESHVAWKKECLAPDICSPVSNGDLIFLVTSSGIMSCYDTQSGEMAWDHDLKNAVSLFTCYRRRMGLSP